MDSPAAVEQLIALGYLPAASAEAKQAVTIAVAESKYNLAVVHSSHGRERKAVSLLEELHAEFPQQPRYAMTLARSHANLGQHAQCRVIIEKLEAAGVQTPEIDLLTAASLFHEGKAEQALARLAECERKYPASAGLFSMIGNMCLARKNWHEAAEAFEKSLAIDDDDPHAHNGLAQACLRLFRYESAAEHALRAVGLLFFYPQAHYHLGMAFQGMREPARAIRSLELAVSQSPSFYEARHQLELLKKSSEKAMGSEDQPRRHEGTR